MIDAVFDTNTFLQAAASENGPSDECWKLVERRIVRIVITESILREIEDVLTRPRIRRRFPHLNVEYVERVLDTFRTFSDLLDEPEEVFSLSRDLDDSKFVNLAVSSNSSYIVTRDRDLLDLMHDPEFTLRFPVLKIVTPVGFLEIVRKA